ncbi:MAG: tail fiber domain-containing protein [Chitinophagaceae bacterium]|nr:tail fiber domain-containing protein [Chitinophagaceae bacterium]
MEATTIGQYNTAIGYQSLTNNTAGSFNTAIGRTTLSLTTSGNFNTALGYAAGNSFNNGSNNTFIGYNADASAASFTNAMALGNGAVVTASNRVRIGNTSVTQIGGEVSWSTLSDGRFKKNIQPSSLGLKFIMELNPVTYNLTDKGQEGNTYTGLVAQEVEKILQEYQSGFSAVTKPENATDRYAIRYADFVMPLINAVKEQQKQIEELKVLVNKMKNSTEIK